MSEEVRIAYTLKQGDTLLKVAECFETTVEKILGENKHIRLNKFNVGEVLTIVPGSIHNIISTLQETSISPKELELINSMRMVWQEHIFWTRGAMISVLEELGDADAVIKRLLKNPNDIASLFSPYYSNETVKAIETLILEHLLIASQLITSLKTGNKNDYDKYNKELYENADQIAQTLSFVNPNYDKEQIRKMMYEHLDLLKKIASNRNNKTYVQEIQAFDLAHQQILMMADILSQGIIKQFPDEF